MCQKRFGGTFLDPQYESFFSIVNQFFGGLKISEYWKRWIKHCWWFPEKNISIFLGSPIDPWNDQTAGKIRDVPHKKMCQKSAKVVRMKPTLPAHRFCFWHADLRCNEIRLEFLILSRYLRSSEPLRSTQTNFGLFWPPKTFNNHPSSASGWNEHAENGKPYGTTWSS